MPSPTRSPSIPIVDDVASAFGSDVQPSRSASQVANSVSSAKYSRGFERDLRFVIQVLRSLRAPLISVSNQLSLATR
jgi:hypothetical protein